MALTARSETSNRPSWTLITHVAHPLAFAMELTLSLPKVIAPRICMGTKPFSDVGLTPAQARGLAAALVAAAEASERREGAENDGEALATDDQGTWFATVGDPSLEAHFVGDGSVVITDR